MLFFKKAVFASAFLSFLCGISLTAHANFEFGATLGSPAGLNANIGVWSPLLLRASGGYWGKGIRGVQGDLGWTFDRTGSFWQFIGASETAISGTSIHWNGVGPTYGFNASGFMLQVGVSIGKGSSGGSKLDGGQFVGQIGYTCIWK